MYDQSITSGGMMTADTPPGATRPTPKELFDELGEAAYELAKAVALKGKARDHHVFMCDWAADPENAAAIMAAQASMPAAPPRQQQPPRKTQETCDGCGWPHWVDEMRVIGGRAYREGCESALVAVWPLGATITERTGVTHEELREIPTADRAYVRPEPSAKALIWRSVRDQIDREYQVELQAEWPDMLALLREHGMYKTYLMLADRPKAMATVKRYERLREIGLCPLRPLDEATYTVGVYGPATELTESARSVQAWKAAAKA